MSCANTVMYNYNNSLPSNQSAVYHLQSLWIKTFFPGKNKQAKQNKTLLFFSLSYVTIVRVVSHSHASYFRLLHCFSACLKLFLHLLVRVSVCALCMRVYECTHVGQRAACLSWLSLSTAWLEGLNSGRQACQQTPFSAEPAPKYCI